MIKLNLSGLMLKHEKDELENHQDTSNISNEISKLKKLYDEGALSEEEYKRAKEKLLK